MKSVNFFLALMLFVSSMSNTEAKGNPNSLNVPAIEINNDIATTPLNENPTTTTNTSVYSEGMAVVKKNGKYGFINRQQVMVITPKFEDVRLFKNNYAAVKLNSGWYFINKQGQKITNTTYEAVSDFDENGYAIVYKDKMYGIINEQGQHIVPVKYKKIQLSADGNLLLQEQNNNWIMLTDADNNDTLRA